MSSIIYIRRNERLKKGDMMNLKDVECKRWSGGTTTELYRDAEDYNIRISCARIDPGESVFSDFTGYQRVLKVLEGKVLITRKEKELELTPGKTLVFGGDEHIKSKNDLEVLDFNVIYKAEKTEAEVRELTGEDATGCKGRTLILSKEDGVTIEIDGGVKVLEKYDFIITDSNEIKTRGDLIAVVFKER